MISARERLRRRMEQLEIEPKKSLGQNFLVSDHVIQKIMSAAKLLRPKTLVEVGPGLGALTDELKNICDNYTLVELDSTFAQYWREQKMKVIEADALQMDWNDIEGDRPKILVSNLPYQISSSLVIERSLDVLPLDGMVLMFQKEVAQRMKAKCGDSTYGFLSVIAQSFWKIETLLEAGPGDFWPPPKIASRVLVFQNLASPVQQKDSYLQFLKACFSQPRKLLLSNLKNELGIDKEKLLGCFAGLKLGEKARAQELTLTQFLDLYKSLGYK